MRALVDIRQWMLQARLALRPRPVLLLDASPFKYVDKLLKRAKPADLSTKPGLAVNLKSTMLLGITISQPISMWADGTIR